MSAAAALQTAPAKPKASAVSVADGLLQRKCACGSSKSPLGEMCDECQSRALQRKLSVGASNDPLELEADRIADRVMAMPVHPAAGATPLRIQRFTGRPSGQMEVAPASVDQVLASPGRPLEPALRQDMEQRFGHDFSRVRVHLGGAAEQSALEVNAHAYTVGQNIVFGTGRFIPETHEGRRLIAHELTHVVQQSDPDWSSVAHNKPQLAIMPYRPKTSANFGACDHGADVEDSFTMKTDKNKKPWIQKISIDFTGTTTDADGDLVPTGELTAKYFSSPVSLADIKVGIVGGKASQGLTDSGAHTVTRIEGCGYHHTSVPKAEQITGHKRAGKYFKDTSKATMNFAVFFVEGPKTGNQAIHEGSLSLGSLACVHVAKQDTIRKINYHSVEGGTKVQVSYSASALKNVCCERFKTKGFMVSNPCKGQDAKKCP